MNTTDTTTRTTEAGRAYVVRVIEGTEHTDHAGLCAILGRDRSRVRAIEAADPEHFPAAQWPDGRPPTGGAWYPITEAQAYARRYDEATGRTIPAPADPAEVLDIAGVADAEGWTLKSAREIAQQSRRAWRAGRPGRLPQPDEGYDPDDPASSSPRDWRWTAGTLAAHVSAGRGGAGRPRT